MLLHDNNGSADALTILHYVLQFRGFWAVSFTAAKVVAVVAVELLYSDLREVALLFIFLVYVVPNLKSVLYIYIYIYIYECWNFNSGN